MIVARFITHNSREKEPGRQAISRGACPGASRTLRRTSSTFCLLSSITARFALQTFCGVEQPGSSSGS